MAAYVSSIHVQYGSANNAISGENINKGFPGGYVYLVASHTNNRALGVHGFSSHVTSIQDLCAADLSRGDNNHERFVYIHSHYSTQGNRPPIRRVWLSERAEEGMGAGRGRTNDLNQGRGGRFLYLCWSTQ